MRQCWHCTAEFDDAGDKCPACGSPVSFEKWVDWMFQRDRDGKRAREGVPHGAGAPDARGNGNG